MKEYKIIFTSRAKDDLILVGDYIAYHLKEPLTARNLMKGFRRKIEGLSYLPGRWSIVQDELLEPQGIHCMPYKNYFVFFIIDDYIGAVNILRIGFNRKNWKEILSPKS